MVGSDLFDHDRDNDSDGVGVASGIITAKAKERFFNNTTPIGNLNLPSFKHRILIMTCFHLNRLFQPYIPKLIDSQLK